VRRVDPAFFCFSSNWNRDALVAEGCGLRDAAVAAPGMELHIAKTENVSVDLAIGQSL
jgi:hypothetical protein